MDKISHNGSRLNLMFFILLDDLGQSLVHLRLIPSDHTYIEPQSSEFLAETKSDAVRTSCYNSPRFPTVPLWEVFGRQDSFNETPDEFGDPDYEDKATDHCEEVDEVQS